MLYPLSYEGWLTSQYATSTSVPELAAPSAIMGA
jgi:hypothetical protein